MFSSHRVLRKWKSLKLYQREHPLLLMENNTTNPNLTLTLKRKQPPPMPVVHNQANQTENRRREMRPIPAQFLLSAILSLLDLIEAGVLVADARDLQAMRALMDLNAKRPPMTRIGNPASTVEERRMAATICLRDVMPHVVMEEEEAEVDLTTVEGPVKRARSQ
jgi:hypothetical protein